MISRCGNCPVSKDETCLATLNQASHGWMCATAKEGNEQKNRHIVDLCRITLKMRSENGSSNPEKPKAILKENAHTKVINSINNCKYRSHKKLIKDENGTEQIIHVLKNEDGSETIHSDCGCGMWRCGKGKGDKEGYVSQRDCIKCIQESILNEKTRQPGLGDFSSQTTGLGHSK